MKAERPNHPFHYHARQGGQPAKGGQLEGSASGELARGVSQWWVSQPGGVSQPGWGPPWQWQWLWRRRCDSMRPIRLIYSRALPKKDPLGEERRGFPNWQSCELWNVSCVNRHALFLILFLALFVRISRVPPVRNGYDFNHTAWWELGGGLTPMLKLWTL